MSQFPQVDAKRATKKSEYLREPRPDLADVALLDLNDVCSWLNVSRSYFLAEVQAGRGPAPVRFGARCTRYRKADVSAWIDAMAAGTVVDEIVKARTKAAGRAAQAKRAAGSRSGGRIRCG